jgi:hypothetical protein
MREANVLSLTVLVTPEYVAEMALPVFRSTAR